MDPREQETEEISRVSIKPDVTLRPKANILPPSSEKALEPRIKSLGGVDTTTTIVPKRKLSVFYRSFEVIAPLNQPGDDHRELIQVRRSSSSPSVPADEERPPTVEKHEERKPPISQSANTLLKSRLSSEFHEDSNLSTKEGRNSLNNKLQRSSPSRVGENMNFEGYDYQKILSKFSGVQNNVDPKNRIPNSLVSQHANESVASSSSQKKSPWTVASKALKQYPAKIKDPVECPRSSERNSARVDRSSDSSGARSLGHEMSSREDSSIGSESEDDHGSLAVIPQVISSQNPPKQKSASKFPLRGKTGVIKVETAISEVESEQRTPSSVQDNRMTTNGINEDCQSVLNTGRNGTIAEKPEERKRSLDTKEDVPHKLHAHKGAKLIERSLSEGDSRCWCKCSCSCRCKGNCKCVAKKPLFQKQDTVKAFPSLNDDRMRTAGLLNLPQGDDWFLDRENLPEDALERKYTAFSIGLGTDRLTLSRRINLSVRQRDLSERNFNSEIQRMQQDIQELSTLCTDRESIEKVERARHRLEMVTRCAHRVSCAAETLGAVHQEHRISRAILIADKYLQILRSRCENLGAEVVELKRILLKNNITIEETTGELGEELPRIRYRSGMPTNNRTMMARRRASIATISRPVISPTDATKEGPRQRNSVSGKISLRRPSLCFESSNWETGRHPTDLTSTGELRDISEQIESRRASMEEKESTGRINRRTSTVITKRLSTDTVLPLDSNNVECEHRTALSNESKPEIEQNIDSATNIPETEEIDSENWSHNSPLRTACAFENRRRESVLCIKIMEHLLRSRENLLEWRSVAWTLMIFFVGFYVKHLTSMLDR